MSTYFMQTSRIRGIQYRAFVYCSVYHDFRMHKLCDFLSFPLVRIDMQDTMLHNACFFCVDITFNIENCGGAEHFFLSEEEITSRSLHL